MRLKQARLEAQRETFRQIDLSAATRDADEQYRWLREQRKPKKERKRREPESLSTCRTDRRSSTPAGGLSIGPARTV